MVNLSKCNSNRRTPLQLTILNVHNELIQNICKGGRADYPALLLSGIHDRLLHPPVLAFESKRESKLFDRLRLQLTVKVSHNRNLVRLLGSNLDLFRAKLCRKGS